VGVTLALAAAGHGPWSIAWGMLVSEFLRAVLMCAFGTDLFRPGLTFQPRALSDLKSFGMFQLGTRMIQSFIQELDVLIVGKVIGREGVGIYSYAKQLVLAPILMIVPIVTQVSFPTMARVQADPERFRGIFLRSLRTVVYLVFPVCALLMVTADEVVILCFGRAWGATLLIVQILAIFAALRAVATLLGVMMNACGRMRRQFMWNLAQLILAPLAMVPMAERGLTGVAWGWTGLQLALVLPGWLALVRPVCGASLRQYFGLFLGPLALSALVVVAGYAAQMPFTGHLARLVAAGVVGGAITLAANAWANRDLVDLLKRGRRAAEGVPPEADAGPR
jgi:O-antigen/teichoic acid export membrane protein